LHQENEFIVEWKVSASSQERWETGTHNKVWYDENERKADPAGVAVNAVESVNMAGRYRT
jgi:predicted lipoprotein